MPVVQPRSVLSGMLVKEVMTSSVVSFPEGAALALVIEGLTSHRFGAVLICSNRGEPRGVISKTDLIRAYHDECGTGDGMVSAH